MKNTLFRKAIIGGFNKEDVMEYVEKLESEIERLKKVEKSAMALEKSVTEHLQKETEKSESDILKESNVTDQMTASLVDEIESIREKAQKYDEQYDAIKRVLFDSRIEAQMILTDANRKAEYIVQDAKRKEAMLRDEIKKKIGGDYRMLYGNAGSIKHELEKLQNQLESVMGQLSDGVDEIEKIALIGETNDDEKVQIKDE